MSKVIIIDDEFLARSMVKEYLKKHPQLEVVAECGDGFEGLKAIQEHQPDLIFLDIQMPKISGFEMLELVENPPAVIFATAFDEYAIKAFEAHAIDYLLKPFDQERFDKAVSKFLAQNRPVAAEHTKELLNDAQLPGSNNRIVVKNGSKIKIIPVQEVLYLEAADDFVKIFTKEGYYLKNKTMSFLSPFACRYVCAQPPFFIVNIQEITRIDPYEKDGHVAILKNGAKINVSRNGYGKLKGVLGL
ncbi:response regulator [Niabella sp. W65]|nr:response regulator [Niabella sp. W65]MCH7361921.1 response regulator [Niabella sp. W65]